MSGIVLWRIAFIVPGAAATLTGIALLAAYLLGVVVDRQTDMVEQAEPSHLDVRRAFIVLVITMALTTLAYHAFTTMLPKWIGQEVGNDLGTGLSRLGALVTMIYLTGALAQFVGGHFADRGLTREIYITSFAIKLLALAGAVVAGSWITVFAAMVVIFAFDIAAPAENILIARYAPSKQRGLAYGVRHGIAIVTAPLGVQLVALFYNPLTGFQAVLFGLCGVVLVILIASLFLPTDKSPGIVATVTPGNS